MKTITYDPAMYKLVPQSQKPDCCDNGATDECCGNGACSFLPKAPADLPGVVTHSGEPVAYCRRDTVLGWRGQQLNSAWMFPSSFGLINPIPLYTHPASTEVEQLRQRVKALEAQRTDAEVWAEIYRLREAVKGPNGYETWQDAATAERVKRVKLEAQLAAQPKPEAIVKAALEAAANKMREMKLSGYAAAIESLDSAAIIQSAKEGK